MGRTRTLAAATRQGFTLDAGALIAIERHDGRMIALLERARGARFAVPVPALAQVWRGTGRQAHLARFLALPDVDIVPWDEAAALAVGVLCGATGASDVVDAFVVLCARERGDRVVTSDVDDLGRIDPGVELVGL
jgi:predicted nucleic acid-binding protein